MANESQIAGYAIIVALFAVPTMYYWLKDGVEFAFSREGLGWIIGQWSVYLGILYFGRNTDRSGFGGLMFLAAFLGFFGGGIVGMTILSELFKPRRRNQDK